MTKLNAPAIATLTEATSALCLLEETIRAVDESITQSKKMTDAVRNRAAEKAAAVLAEAQAQAEIIIIEADREIKSP